MSVLKIASVRHLLNQLLAVGIALLAFHGSACAQVNQAAIVGAKPPKLFSEFGFFEDPGKLIPTKGVLPYSVRNELFSDHAVKSRFVYVPNGKTAQYHASEAFDFPVGSALIKNFAFPADFRQADKNLANIEVRVLLRQADGWKTFAYVWNKDQQDAVLKIAGKRMDVSFVDATGTAQNVELQGSQQEPVQGMPLQQGRYRAHWPQGAKPEL